MIRAFALAAALLLCVSLAGAQPITRADYARMIGEAAQGLERASNAGKDAKPQARAALGNLPQRVEIRPSPGAPAAVADNRELLAVLRSQIARGSNGIRGAAQVLRNLQRSVEVGSTPPRADARAVLARVLRGRAFRPSWVARAQERLNRLINRVIQFIVDRMPRLGVDVSPGTWRVIAWIVIAVAGAIALYLVVRLVLRIAPRAARITGTAPPAPAPLKPYAAWLAEAQGALNSGDYRSALRALHMAALMKLDEAGHIRYADWRTDGRFALALRQTGRDDIADALSGLSVLFASVWYGRAAAGPDEYLAAKRRWDQLEALAAA